MKNLKKNIDELVYLFSELSALDSAENKRLQKVLTGFRLLLRQCMGRAKIADSIVESYCNFRSAVPLEYWENWVIRKFLHLFHLTKKKKQLTKASYKFFLNYIKNSLDIPDNKDDYPIHAAVLSRNLYKIRQLCIGDDSRYFHTFIDQVDPVGNTALMLAVKLKHYEAVQVLIDHGADAKYRLTNSMPSPLEVAVEMNDKPIISILVTGYHRDLYTNWTNNIEEFSKALLGLNDFSIRMSWECISRLIPFIKRFTPSDDYLICKKGNKVKIDLTLVGFEQLTARRGQISIVFNGDYNRVLLIDHRNKTTRELFGDLNYEQIEKHTSELIKNKKYSTDLIFNECSVQPCKTWRGQEQVKPIAGFLCKKHSVNCGIALSIHKRPVFMERNLSSIKSIDEYFQHICSKTRKNLLISGKVEKKTQKIVKVSTWSSNNFPLKISNFLPIIELLSSVSQKVRRFSDLISMESIIQDLGFPLRTKIPIIMTVTALVTFADLMVDWQGDIEFEKCIAATIDEFDVKSMRNPPSSDRELESEEDTVLGPKLTINPTPPLNLEEADETFIRDFGIFEDEVKQKVKLLGSHRSIINKVKTFIETQRCQGNDVDIEI